MIAQFVLMQYLTLSCKTQVLLWHLLNEGSVLHRSVLLLVAALSMCASHSSEVRTTLVGFLLKGLKHPCQRLVLYVHKASKKGVFFRADTPGINNCRIQIGLL